MKKVFSVYWCFVDRCFEEIWVNIINYDVFVFIYDLKLKKKYKYKWIRK